MNKKVLLIISLIIIICASVITNICILSRNNDNSDDNNIVEVDGVKLVRDKSILKDRKVDNLDITDVSLITRDGVSLLYATISNNTEADIYIDKMYVVFYDNDIENKILVSSSLKLISGDSTNLNITSEIDLSNTTKIEYLIEYQLND